MTAPSAMMADSIRRHRPLVVLLGPTATGKSAVGVQVAQRYHTEILTADSRQVYRGMDIGTDKPSMQERQGIAHRLIDLADPDEPYNAGRYQREALGEIDRVIREGCLPFVVGGTGLYIRALIRGICDAPEADADIRQELMALVAAQGRDGLYAELVRVDPVTAARLHPNDESKVIRALEVYRLAGCSLASLHARHQSQAAAFPTLLIGLQRPKEMLYRRIEARIDWQLTHGMVEETRALLARGYSRALGSMKGLGYRHLAAHFAGEYDADEMIRQFKQDTRHFAKRQMTWFRKEPGIIWLTIDAQESTSHTADRVVALIERFMESLDTWQAQSVV
ncbi:MAG: tRNA (adenosine(37)-N6)-dimethylallyltransferase MiaA [Nitrospira sp.]|nr:tRNA (adenosine(37)-N6)-dimethylallyltransferase MiaA [Nitrospira sp.]